MSALSVYLVFLLKDVRERIDIRRKRAINAHSQAKNIMTPKFVVAGFVSIYKLTRLLHKLTFFKAGKRRVLAVRSLAVCMEQELNTRKAEAVHFTRIRK